MSEQPSTLHDNGTVGWMPHDDLPADALDLLAPAERAAFERHLSDCGECQQELAAHGRLRELLPRGLDPASPPAGARERLLARARAETEPPVQAVAPEVAADAGPTVEPGAQVDEPPPPPRRAALEPIPTTHPPQRPRQKKIRLATLGWAAALLFVLASGLFVGAWSATGPHASFAVEVQARLPGGRIVPLSGTGAPTAKARLFVLGDGRTAELATDQLPPLRDGRVYQLWFMEQSEPIKTGGTFTVDARGDATARITVPAPVERIQSVVVTEEPAPSSPAPTGPHLLDWPLQ